MPIAYGEKLLDALRQLVEISENLQQSLADNRKWMSHKDWLKQFCTVKVGTSRRGGHTYAALKLAASRKGRTLVLCLNVPNKKILDERLKALDVPPEKVDIETINVAPLHLAGRGPYETIIIDCASFVSVTKMDVLYEGFIPLMADSHPKLVVLLQ